MNDLISQIDGEIGIYAEGIYSKNIFTLNHDVIFPSASVIKVPILYFLYQNILEGNFSLFDEINFDKSKYVPDSPFFDALKYDKDLFSLYDLAFSMITLSDNTSTNLLIDFLGMEKINQFIKNIGMKNTKLQRKMYDFESRKKGIDNITTPEDIAILIKKLLFSVNFKLEIADIKAFDLKHPIKNQKDVSLGVLKILSEQKDLEKIPSGFNNSVLIANKPGELDGIRNDIALIVTDKDNFIVSIFTKEVSDELLTDILIGKIANYLVNNAL